MDECSTVLIVDSAVICALFLFIFAVWISICYRCISFDFTDKIRKRTSKVFDCEAGYPNTKLAEIEEKLRNEEAKVTELQTGLGKEKGEKEDALKRLAEKEKKLRNEEVKAAALRIELGKEKDEKEDALKRLSAIMSSHLRDGNPNVVDLSDQNRPIKVGEQFSELYDNQWTDAYSALEVNFKDSMEEPEIISMLLDILQQCFEACKHKASEQLTQLNENVTNISAIITRKTSKLSTDLMQRIKEERKMFASDKLPECDQVMPILKEHFSSRNSDTSFLEENSLKVFVQECLKLSWLMVIQDPPMTIIMTPEAKENENFKAYKHRGKQIVFVVWPALLLNEGGPLIMKGIAEFNDVFKISEKL